MSANLEIVECVPNFCEGRDKAVIKAIGDAIQETSGCTMLDVATGSSTNRTIYTFVGSPKAVLEGAMNAAIVAHGRIDMAKHIGEHKRIGALDVCPFAPVTNVSLDKCVELSKKFGEQLASKLHVPVYLYAEAQEKEYRKQLSKIRKGEYEGLCEKLSKPEWKPDFGSAEFVPSWGATVTGARNILITFSVNLLGTKEQAHRIANNVKEKGGPNESGLKGVKAMSWFLKERNVAQVSMSLYDYEATPMHIAFERCCKEAKELKVAVVGSEVVGLVPLKAMLMAAKYYSERDDLFIPYENQQIHLVVQRLGLNSISEFEAEKKIIEYQMGNRDGPLLISSVRIFVENIGSRSFTPAGGSASACIASMGAALGAMVGQATFGKKQFEKWDPLMRKCIGPLYTAMHELMLLIDQDAVAYDAYVKATHLPEEERTRHLNDCLKEAIEVPMSLMKTAFGCWEHMETLAAYGNFIAIPDLELGVRSLDTGIHGACNNIHANLKLMTDTESEYIADVRDQVQRTMEESEQRCQYVLKLIRQRTPPRESLQ